MRKIKCHFTGVLFLVFMLASAFTCKELQTTQKRRPFCGFNAKDGYYYGQQEVQYITRPAVLGDRSGIPDVIEEIKSRIGIDVPIYVYIAKDENNCSATIIENGKRAIIADHLFLNKVDKDAGTKWAAISIIAHEVGHHIAGFSRRATSQEGELDADYWSGYILYKLGAGQEASVKCIMFYGTEYDSGSHPNKYARAEAIRTGWNDGSKGDFDKDRCESCD